MTLHSVCSMYSSIYNGSTAIGTTPGCFAGLPSTSRPSQNVGSSLPGTNNLSTPSSVITAIRTTPPDEPSRAIANASAAVKHESTASFPEEQKGYLLTVLDELDRLIAPPALLVRRVAVAIDVGRSRAPNRPRLAEETAAEWDVVHARTDLLVPSRDDDAGAQCVLVRVAYAFEQRRGDVYGWWATARLSASTGNIIPLKKKKKIRYGNSKRWREQPERT